MKLRFGSRANGLTCTGRWIPPARRLISYWPRAVMPLPPSALSRTPRLVLVTLVPG